MVARPDRRPDRRRRRRQRRSAELARRGLLRHLLSLSRGRCLTTICPPDRLARSSPVGLRVRRTWRFLRSRERRPPPSIVCWLFWLRTPCSGAGCCEGSRARQVYIRASSESAKRVGCLLPACSDRVFGSTPTAPESRTAGVMKLSVQEQVKLVLVEWPAVQARLREQGIVLVGGGAR